MDNLNLYNSVRAVPQDAQKKIGAGRLKGMTDINPMWRIKVLTEHFGVCGFGWYYEVTNKWTETIGQETAAFVDILLYVKDGEWSKPIHGTGGSMLAAKEKNGIYVSDEAFKKATTDAISVACKQLGIGADVYWQSDSTKYTTPAQPQPILSPPATIGLEKALDLATKLREAGVKADDVVKLYKVPTLKDLTETKLANINDHWQEIVSRFAKAPENDMNGFKEIPEGVQAELPFK